MNTTASSAHGGARSGAGRKPNAVKHEQPIQSATERCAQRLPRTLDELERLAEGVPVTQERWVAAGTLTIGRGKDARPAFPHLPPEQLVLVSRTTTSAKPDARAVLYLADRVMGRLTSSDEAQVEEQIGVEIAILIERVQTRFTPESAHLILTTLSCPEPPAAPLDLTPVAPAPSEQILQQDTSPSLANSLPSPPVPSPISDAASTPAESSPDTDELSTPVHVSQGNSIIKSSPSSSNSPSAVLCDKPRKQLPQKHPQIQVFKSDNTNAP